MSRQSSHSHQYGGQSPPAPRYSSAHSNSSAFSASAGPNEDWTKISDLAERRRIQNRIAQRNYRKKLKRRLEDLERRAASSSPEPSLDEAQLDGSRSPPVQRRHRPHALSAPNLDQRRSPSPSFHRSVSSYDEDAAFAHHNGHQPSPTPSIFSHPSFSTSESNYSSSYSLSPSYPSSTVAASEAPMFGNYLLPRIVTTPYLAPHEGSSVKHEPYEREFDSLALNYLPAAGTEVPRSEAYRGNRQNPYTPTLSESESADSLDESFPSSVLGSPLDLWALYPTPPASVSEDDPPFFSLPIDLALEDPDFFTSSSTKHDPSLLSF